MQASEFVKVLENCKNCDQWEEIVHDYEFESYGDEGDDLISELKNQGYTLAYEDHYGGEGQGDDYWDVFSVEHNAEITYFRLDGWYSSYDGATYNDPYKFIKVKKVPKQIFEWVKDE